MLPVDFLDDGFRVVVRGRWNESWDEERTEEEKEGGGGHFGIEELEGGRVVVWEMGRRERGIYKEKEGNAKQWNLN